MSRGRPTEYHYKFNFDKLVIGTPKKYRNISDPKHFCQLARQTVRNNYEGVKLSAKVVNGDVYLTMLDK